MANNRKFGWHSGTMSCKNARILGDLTIQDTLIFGDVSFGELAIKGRMSSGTKAGTAIDIDANYSFGQGHEFRWTISSWTGTGNTFDGQYLRAQNDIANASGDIRGMQISGVGNDVNTQGIWGILAYAYVKGTTAKTVSYMYAIQPELTWDASANTCTLSTEAICVRAKITGGKVDDYTKIHGVQVKAGDMNGASVTYGNGYWLLDDSGMSGTVSWTVGLNLAADCVTGIDFTGAFTNAAISMDGATFANGDHEIQMRNTVAGDKTIIAAGTATNDSAIVTAVGADTDIADGSLYLSATDSGGVLFVKTNDVWKPVTVT